MRTRRVSASFSPSCAHADSGLDRYQRSAPIDLEVPSTATSHRGRIERGEWQQRRRLICLAALCLGRRVDDDCASARSLFSTSVAGRSILAATPMVPSPLRTGSPA